jgi:hypothetical protein
MSQNKIRYTAGILLLLYAGYFSCVSYYVHSHVYNGMVYVHSHPYDKRSKGTDDRQLPFETHHHTSAGFFTFNQISDIASLEAASTGAGKVYIPQITYTYRQVIPEKIISPVICYFNHRAPPVSFS